MFTGCSTIPVGIDLDEAKMELRVNMLWVVELFRNNSPAKVLTEKLCLEQVYLFHKTSPLSSVVNIPTETI